MALEPPSGPVGRPPVPCDLLLPDGDAVIALSRGLRIKRTLDGAEIVLPLGAIGGRNVIAPSRVALV
jgi:hypothetical protein